MFAACALQPTCHEAFPNAEQDFYASYEALTKSPIAVSVASRAGEPNTVWVDGSRLVTYIRDRMVTRLDIGRVPLLSHELRSGDRARAAREIAGDGAVSQTLSGRAVRELVTCYDSSGPQYRKSLGSINALVRAPFRRADDPGDTIRDDLGTSEIPLSRQFDA